LNHFINCQSHFENMLTREYTQELIRFEQDILEKFNA